MEGVDGYSWLTQDTKPAWLPPLQKVPQAKARTEGCAWESLLTAGLAGELRLEKKLRPMLTWLHRHIVKVKNHPIELYLWTPSSHWLETGSSQEQCLALWS